jgi:hypothetical protein
MNARTILLLGGSADGRQVIVLHGTSVLVEAQGKREFYEVAEMMGSTGPFFVGVPPDRVLDGDWIIQRLLDGYKGVP